MESTTAAVVAEEIGLQRLHTLAKHLEFNTLGHVVFDIRIFNDVLTPRCGEAGDALGECPIVWPELWFFGDGGLPRLKAVPTIDPLDAAALFFGQPTTIIRHLFFAYEQNIEDWGGKDLNDDASRYDVAAQLAAFVLLKSHSVAA